MDKKLVGLLGAAAVTTLASAQATPTSPPHVPEVTRYRDLLDPVPNPIPKLQAGNARLAEQGSQGTRLAQVSVQIGHHHHHQYRRYHHHHHHYHHHHHHHHHHGVGVYIR